MATFFVMNVSRNRKVKKLAYLPGYWLDLAQIWCSRVATNLKNSGNLKNCQNVRENSGKFKLL